MEVKSPTRTKHELGQFFTPAHVAEFMASMFSMDRAEWRLLDAGAGGGSLSVALIARICETAAPSTRIKLTAYELDSSIVPKLRRACESARKKCESRGIYLSVTIVNADFIECGSEIIQGNLFSRDDYRFNAVIMNPPYRKINSNSQTRRLLRGAGIEASNLYTGFLAIATKLLCKTGELVAITPRSFSNGPYFRPFRKQFLATMSLRQIHVFDSRSAAFAGDNVLQENVIMHAVKSDKKPSSVRVSASSGKPGASIRTRDCAFNEIVDPTDAEAFIHLVPDCTDLDIRVKMSTIATSLSELGLSVSTGRVVDFRAASHLRESREGNVVPLIRPCHFDGGFIRWPAPRERKPCAIADSEATRELLVRQGNYVLVKRFSAKEERKRIVACVYNASSILVQRVGFENHLNYFHADGGGLTIELAKGLAAFLNSTTVDMYFRHFSGHTQVNATDLRSLRYPSLDQLEKLGATINGKVMGQSDLDALVNHEVF